MALGPWLVAGAATMPLGRPSFLYPRALHRLPVSPVAVAVANLAYAALLGAGIAALVGGAMLLAFGAHAYQAGLVLVLVAVPTLTVCAAGVGVAVAQLLKPVLAGQILASVAVFTVLGGLEKDSVVAAVALTAAWALLVAVAPLAYLSWTRRGPTSDSSTVTSQP